MMKSLEIVNEMVDYWESAFAIAETAYKTHPTNGWFDDLEVSKCKTKLEKYKQIKQDLEVLEIIKKKRVNVGDLAHVFRIGGADEEGLDFYNAYIKDETKLSLKELLKVKQWLEENEK